MKTKRKRHQATIEQARRAKLIEQDVLESLGNAASYVARAYIYMRVGEEMGVSARTAQEMLNNVPEAEV